MRRKEKFENEKTADNINLGSETRNQVKKKREREQRKKLSGEKKKRKEN